MVLRLYSGRRLAASRAWTAAVWVALLLMGGRLAQAQELPHVRWEGRTMGSPYTVQVVGVELEEQRLDTLKAEVEARLREVNRQMSHYQTDSELSRFNRAPSGVPFKVSPEFARVVRFSLAMFRDTKGALDPTLGPLINLWGFGERTEQKAVPSDTDLRAALRKTGANHLRVTERDELVKDLDGLTLNLSAVAKGFGVDEMLAVVRSHGFTNVYASIAGEVGVLGLNSRGTKWLVGISAPVDNWKESDPMAAMVPLSNRALSTSGDYQKFFTDAQGRRLSHILDPRTGWPVQHAVTGVSVVATNNMLADALGTALFVMGHEDGLRFIESLPDAAALFIVRDPTETYRVIRSSRFPSSRSP